jgi:PAS domain S-box-containing protein
MGVIDQEKVDKIKQFLTWNPRGLTISDLSSRLAMNRNLVAKYLDILLISGQVEMQVIGAAKVYFLSHRVPVAAMLEFSSDLVIMLNSEKKILGVNEPVLLLFDIKREDIVGKQIDETGIPFICDLPVSGNVKKYRKGGEPATDIDGKIRGEDHHFRIKQVPSVFEDGSQGITFIIEDITVGKKFQEIVKQSEERFRSVVDGAPFPMSITDSSGRHVFLNRSFIATFGYTPEEIPDWITWIDHAFADPGDKLDAVEFWGSVLHGTGNSRGISQRFRILCKNGTIRNIYFTPVHLSDGSSVFVGKDTTEQEEVFRLRDLLGSIIRSSEEAMIGITRDCRIASWNPAAELLYGYHENEVVKNPFDMLVPVNGHTGLDLIFQRVWRGEYIQRYEMKMLRRNGSAIDVQITISAIKGEEGEITGASSIVRDITKEKLEQHLCEFEDRYRTLVQDLNVGIYRSTADPRGRFVWGNSALLNILGYNSMVDLQGINVIDVFFEPNVRVALVDELQRSGFVKNRVLHLKRRDGTPITVNVTALAEFDEKKNVILINGIVQDITGFLDSETGQPGSKNKEKNNFPKNSLCQL